MGLLSFCQAGPLVLCQAGPFNKSLSNLKPRQIVFDVSMTSLMEFCVNQVIAACSTSRRISKDTIAAAVFLVQQNSQLKSFFLKAKKRPSAARPGNSGIRIHTLHNRMIQRFFNKHRHTSSIIFDLLLKYARLVCVFLHAVQSSKSST